jgi:hypothetical protein
MIHLANFNRSFFNQWFVCLLALFMGASHVWAQTGLPNSTPPSTTAASPGNEQQANTKPHVQKTTAASTNPSTPAPTKPAWAELNGEQQLALKPLAAQWNTLSEPQKRKWIRISHNFASLSEAEQSKMHSRMVGWVSLSPKERAQARLNFAEAHRLSASEKSSNWEAYQALSPEEKKQLAAQGLSKPAGASAPIKPVPPEKLSVVPVTQPASRPTPKIAVSANSVQSNTLLPQVAAPAAAEATEKH